MKKVLVVNNFIMTISFITTIVWICFCAVNDLGGGKNSLLVGIVTLVFSALSIISWILQIILCLVCLFKIGSEKYSISELKRKGYIE